MKICLKSWKIDPKICDFGEKWIQNLQKWSPGGPGLILGGLFGQKIDKNWVLGWFWWLVGARSAPGSAGPFGGIAFCCIFGRKWMWLLIGLAAVEPRRGSKITIFGSKIMKNQQKSIQEGFQKKHEKLMKNRCQNYDFWVPCILKSICFSEGKHMFFEKLMFRKKVAKSMQKEIPKVIQIHENRSLGGQGPIFWPPGVVFWGGEKALIFWSLLGRPKIDKNRPVGAQMVAMPAPSRPESSPSRHRVGTKSATAGLEGPRGSALNQKKINNKLFNQLITRRLCKIWHAVWPRARRIHYSCF